MSLTKEVHRLTRRVRKLTDGQVYVDSFETSGCDEDQHSVLRVVLEPNDGLYKGGRFRFTITIPDSYPYNESPAVWCESKIFHPNIDSTDTRYDDFATNVCLNILEIGVWNNALGLEGMVLGLLFLMHNPNFDDPLSPYFDPGEDDWNIENVKRFMNREAIDGVDFELEEFVKNDDEQDSASDTNTQTNAKIEPDDVVVMTEKMAIETKEAKDDKVGDDTNCAVDKTPTLIDQEKDEISIDSDDGDHNDIDDDAFRCKLITIDGEIVLFPNNVDFISNDVNKDKESGQKNDEVTGSGVDTDGESDGKVTDMEVDDNNESPSTTLTTSNKAISDIETQNSENNRTYLEAEVEQIETSNGGLVTTYEEKKDNVTVDPKLDRKSSISDDNFRYQPCSPKQCDNCLGIKNAKQNLNETNLVKRIARKVFVKITYFGCRFLDIVNNHNRY